MIEDARIVVGARPVADAETHAAAHAAAFLAAQDRWSAAAFESQAATAHCIWAEAFEKQRDAEVRLLGFLVARRAGDLADLLTICVAPCSRRCGLGRTLLNASFAALKAADICTIIAEVSVENTAAQSLYAQLGFRAIGRRSGYYRRSGRSAVDALTLEKTLR